VKNANTFLGIVLVLAGLIDILLMPVIFQRLWTQPQSQSALVLRMVRISGLFMIILGFLFLVGVMALP
jgi:uncharacterized protein YjeT (DUF2065 family)